MTPGRRNSILQEGMTGTGMTLQPCGDCGYMTEDGRCPECGLGMPHERPLEDADPHWVRRMTAAPGLLLVTYFAPLVLLPVCAMSETVGVLLFCGIACFTVGRATVREPGVVRRPASGRWSVALMLVTVASLLAIQCVQLAGWWPSPTAPDWFNVWQVPASLHVASVATALFALASIVDRVPDRDVARRTRRRAWQLLAAAVAFPLYPLLDRNRNGLLELFGRERTHWVEILTGLATLAVLIVLVYGLSAGITALVQLRRRLRLFRDRDSATTI